jgi:hypothetical protein
VRLKEIAQKELTGGLQVETRPPGQEEGSGRDRPTRGLWDSLSFVLIKEQKGCQRFTPTFFSVRCIGDVILTINKMKKFRFLMATMALNLSQNRVSYDEFGRFRERLFGTKKYDFVYDRVQVCVQGIEWISGLLIGHAP